MPHRFWRPNIDGICHTVVARWSPWTYDGELVLNTAIIKTWGLRMAGPDINFKIEGQSGSLRKTLTGFDLYIDEKKIVYQ